MQPGRGCNHCGNLGRVAVDAAAELMIGGEGLGGTTMGGGEEASKDGSLSLLSLTLTATAAELKAGAVELRMAVSGTRQ
jgi:hypothetical protein